MSTTRRSFLQRAGTLGAAVVAGRSLFPTLLNASPGTSPSPAAGPLVIASANGLAAVGKAMEIIRQGNDALDGVIAGVNIVEDDPNDVSVGYGGMARPGASTCSWTKTASWNWIPP